MIYAFLEEKLNAYKLLSKIELSTVAAEYVSAADHVRGREHCAPLWYKCGCISKSLEIGDGIYVWTNTSTQSKPSVLSRLFKLYDEAPADLVFYFRDGNDANADEPGSCHELRRKYWTYALPIIQKAHGVDGSFSNVSPSIK